MVSIIMPAYNAEDYIDESILSVQAQTFSNWELIIIDDGSTDSTANIIKDFQRTDGRIVYFYQKNKRLGAARNAGLKLAKGGYLAFLDSDDLWMPEKLEVQINAFNTYNVDLIFTSGYILHQGQNLLTPYPTVTGFFTGEEMFKLEFFVNYIPILSVLMKKEWLEKIGLQNEELEFFGCEDWDYWLRLSHANANFYGMPEKLFKYRVHEGGMSRKNTLMKLAEFSALFNNIDFKIISKNETYTRLKNLMKENVPGLVNIGRQKDAIEIIKKVNKIKLSIRYSILILFIISSKPLFKLFRYLFHPKQLLYRLKHQR